MNELAKMSISRSSAVRVRRSPSAIGAFFFWAVSSEDDDEVVGASSEARGAVDEASEAAALLVVTMKRHLSTCAEKLGSRVEFRL